MLKLNIIFLIFFFTLVFSTLINNEGGERAIKRQEEGLWENKNGIELNGLQLNGIAVNGVPLNRIASNGVTLNGISINGISINGVMLNGARLNGISINGGTWNGISLNGGTWNGISINGISINGIEPNGIAINGFRLNGIEYSGGGFNGFSIRGVVVNSTEYTFGNNHTSINGFFVNNGTSNSSWSNLVSSLILSGVVLDERLSSELTTTSVPKGTFTLEGASISTPSKIKGAVLKGGRFVPHVWAQGSSLKAQVDGRYVTGTEWEDSILLFSAILFANESLVIEYLYGVIVQNVIQDGDLFTYNITGLDGAPFCDQGLSTIIPNSFWDNKNGAVIQKDGLFTIACAGGALYKCSALLKYRPYAKHGNPSVSLANHHQACVRMMRADYCGSGYSHTVNGKVIDVWDALIPAINTRENATWAVEAHWGPSGAICFNSPRIKGGFGGWCKSYLPKCTSSTPNRFVANSFPPSSQ